LSGQVGSAATCSNGAARKIQSYGVCLQTSGDLGLMNLKEFQDG
jgi:hypothetical protein